MATLLVTKHFVVTVEVEIEGTVEEAAARAGKSLDDFVADVADEASGAYEWCGTDVTEIDSEGDDVRELGNW